MATIGLSAQSRSGSGKGLARQLRRTGRIPAILYGEMVDEPTNLSVDTRELRTALTTSAGFRVVINLKIDDSLDRVAIIKEIQRDPVTQQYLHADLVAIDLKKPIEVSIPIVGHGTPIGVKMDDGVLGWARRELNIRVLPTQIPEQIEVDVSELHVGQSIHVGALTLDGVEILDDEEVTVCSVSSTRVIEEETPEGEEGVEGEGAEGEGDAAGSEAAAEKPDGE